MAQRFALLSVPLLVFAACSDPAADATGEAQLRAPPPPLRTKLPQNIDAKLHIGIGGSGFAFTPDGRVVVQDFVVPTGPEFPFCGIAVGWVVRVLRHEGLGHEDSNGTPVFDDNSWSPPLPIALNDIYGTNGISGHVALAVTIAPEMQTLPFPYPSDDLGNLDADGAYETYDLVIVTQPWDVHGIDPSLGCNQNIANLTVENRLVEKRLKVVVENGRTNRATIAHAELSTAFNQLGWRPETSTTTQSLVGLEPTISFDGRVIIWQGHPDNNAPAIDADHLQHRSGIIMYSFNEDPSDPNGWSMPRSINQMYFEHRDVMIDGVRFADRYPLAAQPLRAADGTVLGQNDMYLGAYPWASLDVSELYHTATQFQTSNLQNGFSVIGRDTGYALRLVDGPLNPDRQVSRKVIHQGTGVAPGLWAPARDMVQPPLPYTGARRVTPIFGMATQNYGEVSFDEFVDRDYIVALEMNEMIELVRFGNLVTWRFDLTRTPDISGRFNTASLEGASFPPEAGLPDRNHGVVGQAVVIDPGAAIRVPDAPSFDETTQAMTAELFVRPVGALGPQTILEKADAFGLYTDGADGVYATVWVGGVLHSTSVAPTNLNAGPFTHLAFTYDAGTGALVLFENGVPIAKRDVGGPIDRRSADLLIGAGPAQTNRMLVDEVKISRVARTAAELRRAAYVFDAPAPRAPSPALPLGLDPDEFIVPANNPMTSEKIALGRRLFFERRLSIDESTSCATCHDPDLAFTDGFPLAIGLFGQVLGRNTPTTLNRGFSTTQFWDGRAPTLEIQAPMPIEHPDEMGLPIDDALARLNSDADYVAEFLDVFGEAPTRENLGRALATFERATVTGGSRVDMFEAGRIEALTIPEIRGWILFSGKARCVACHTGSNYSDEALHVALDRTSDLGAFAVTGREADREAFKTPTLRNVIFTAPYFHDGSAPTLEAVIERYDRGGNRTERRDPEIFPLGLTDQDKSDLAAFLRALASPIETISP